MAKEDVVAAAKSKVMQEQDQALNDGLSDAYDGGASDQKAADGTGTSPSDQAIIDGLNAQIVTLTQQVSDLQAKDASDIQAGQDAVASIQASMTDLQSRFDILSAKESTEAGVLQGLQGSIAALQNVIVVLQGLPTQPVPIPVPDQPVQP